MDSNVAVDSALVQWGERLFYPRIRTAKSMPPARLEALTRRKAAVIRHRIIATVSRRAPQVMVKVTGGGRGMKAIAAHFRYISKGGRLPIEDGRGVVSNDKDGLHDLAEQWRSGGSLIGDVSPRREAFNIMLSMPHGTDPSIVQKAAREFAQAELKDHLLVMVLHDHQAHPHVHLTCVPSLGSDTGSTRARPICTAGARPSRRSCEAGASMRKRHGRQREAQTGPSNRCGA